MADTVVCIGMEQTVLQFYYLNFFLKKTVAEIDQAVFD